MDVELLKKSWAHKDSQNVALYDALQAREDHDAALTRVVEDRKLKGKALALYCLQVIRAKASQGIRFIKFDTEFSQATPYIVSCAVEELRKLGFKYDGDSYTVVIP